MIVVAPNLRSTQRCHPGPPPFDDCRPPTQAAAAGDVAASNGEWHRRRPAQLRTQVIPSGDHGTRVCGGEKMEDMVAGIVCMLVVFAIFPLVWWRRRRISSSPHEHEEELQPQQVERVVRQSGTRRMRRRGAASSSTATTTVEDALVESDEEVLETDQYGGRETSKKDKKRQEREEHRQAEEAARESRRTKQDRYAEMRRRKDEEREAEERRMEEEALARKVKEEEAASLEFAKWKGEFSVDDEGTTQNEMQDDGQDLLFNFVEYIKKQKCVPLEELSAEFKMRTQDCINRIATLETMGRLSGVMDDRGKYIYISPEEMKAVADYISRQGRVSIAHLASQSNQFIDLDPKPQFVEVEAECSSSGGIEVA